MATHTHYNDSELLSRLRAGSHQAFAALYARYSEPLYLHIFQKLNCREDARDVLQELFLSIWDRRTELPADVHLSSYLYTAAKYKIINFVARQQVKNRALVGLADQLLSARSGTDFRVRERELTVEIEKAVAGLPTKMQAIFRMSREEQLSHKEIAHRLNLSETTVKKQVANAIKLLKPSLKSTLATCFALALRYFL